MPKNASISYINTCFYKGKYKDVLSEIGQELISPQIPDYAQKTFLQVACMVFLGRFREAQILFEQSLKDRSISVLHKVRCQFYLGIGCIRKSDYRSAINYFLQNLRILKLERANKDINEISFYAYQGSAFYHFFCGQFKKTIYLTNKSYSSAYKDNFKYGQVLSLDLLGHSLCQIGSVSRGLKEIKNAIAIAKQLGNGGITTALQVSLIKYKAQFGVNFKQTIANLEKGIQFLKPQDTYSQAELYLELIRQLTLRGKGTEAKNILEKVGQLIYQHQNKRHYATFNLRCAHLLLLNGDTQAALALATSLKNNLDPIVDTVILCQAVGLVEKINASLTSEVKPIVNFPTRPTHILDSRIRSRNGHKDNISINSGADLLGDIIDSAYTKKHEFLYQIKSLGLWGLVAKVLDLPVGISAIYLGPSRSELIIFNGADVIWYDKGITQPIKKLILNLKGDHYKSKEELIQNVWGYSYNPIYHDQLLHATIGKLRNLMGKNMNWIEWSSDGYKISDSIFVYSHDKTDGENRPHTQNSNYLPKMLKKQIKEKTEIVDLNIRQYKLLNTLKLGDFINVRQYAKHYKICTMTACRDLTHLHQNGQVIRIGKGRATVYCLPKEDQ